MTTKNRGMFLSILKTSAYPWLIVCCGMLFYCYNYFLRVSPSVMQPELTHAFHITATQFGALAGFYYYAYTPMQVPAGLIYDKFGVRFVLCVACLLAVAGVSMFISANNYMTAGTARFIIGLGCAFAYIGTLKLASLWLPPNRFATVAGCATAVGMVSGAVTQKYLSKAVLAVGYQQALQTALIAGIVLSVLVVLLVRNRPKDNGETHPDLMHTAMNVSQLWRALVIIFCNKQMWLIGIIGCLLYLPSSVFLDLWGIPYLQTVHNMTAEQAVSISGATFYGWIISGPIIGVLSDKFKRRVIPLTFTGLFAAILLCVVFYYPGLNSDYFNLIFFMIGFCCGAHPLTFALGKENNPVQISGTAVAVTNMLIMLGGMVFQPVVGWLLDMHATSIGANGLPVYSASDYTFALSVVPIGVALGIFLSIFLRETHCESVAQEEHKRIFRPTVAEPLPSEQLATERN